MDTSNDYDEFVLPANDNILLMLGILILKIIKLNIFQSFNPDFEN